MGIERLVWRAANDLKLRDHGIDPDEVQEMVDNDTYWLRENPAYSDQVLVTGYTVPDRWLTVAMEPLGSGAYRPITGWPATRREIWAYIEEER